MQGVGGNVPSAAPVKLPPPTPVRFSATQGNCRLGTVAAHLSADSFSGGPGEGEAWDELTDHWAVKHQGAFCTPGVVNNFLP